VADVSFSPSGDTCAVALHRSGVVLGIDSESRSIATMTETAESLEKIVVLVDGRFVAKVWDSDRFAAGLLR
jgi:hypothetical protein